MGKGDKRSTKGKINSKSYGKARDRKTNRPKTNNAPEGKVMPETKAEA